MFSRAQWHQPNHDVLVSNSCRGIEFTPETAEPLGLSPPLAADLLLIKKPSLGAQQSLQASSGNLPGPSEIGSESSFPVLFMSYRWWFSSSTSPARAEMCLGTYSVTDPGIRKPMGALW